MRFLLTYHYSDVAKMSAGDVARYIDAESPQEAVNFLVSDEERSGFSVTNIKVYNEIESPDGKWEASE